MAATKSSGFIAGIVVLGLLLVGLGVLYFTERNENKKHIEDLNIAKAELEEDLEALSLEYDSLETDNDSLTYKLEVEKTKIQELLKKLKGMKTTNRKSYAEISRYKDEIASMKTLLEDYVFQIDSLNLLAMQLQEENVFIKDEIKKVQEENTELKDKTASLEEVVAKAAALETLNLQAYPANKRNKKVKRLGWTKKIKTEFTLNKNVTAAPGTKDVYVIIKRPDDVVLSNPSGDSFMFNDTKTVYSAKRQVLYGGDYLPVALYWDNDGSLVKGEYKADIVIDDAIIGQTKFYIK